jgi:hypothetical protein
MARVLLKSITDRFPGRISDRFQENPHVKEWGIHYNRGRPHSSLGPGIPEPNQESVPASDHRHRLPAGYRVAKTSVLGGLHHEYSLVK